MVPPPPPPPPPMQTAKLELGEASAVIDNGTYTQRIQLLGTNTQFSIKVISGWNKCLQVASKKFE